MARKSDHDGLRLDEAALAGTMTVDQALAKAQASTEAAMKKGGYIK